jgi:hypothetical protein
MSDKQIEIADIQETSVYSKEYIVEVQSEVEKIKGKLLNSQVAVFDNVDELFKHLEDNL